MQMKKANEKAQGNEVASPMSDSECVALLETVQQSLTCCPSPCVFDELQISSKLHGKSQYPFYSYTCFFQVFLQSKKAKPAMFKAITLRVFISRTIYSSLYTYTHQKTWSSSKRVSSLCNTVMLEFPFLWQMSRDAIFPCLLSPA